MVNADKKAKVTKMEQVILDGSHLTMKNTKYHLGEYVALRWYFFSLFTIVCLSYRIKISVWQCLASLGMLDMFGISGGPDVLSYVRTIGIGRIYGSFKGKLKLRFRLTRYNGNQKRRKCHELSRYVQKI